jgi:hypothetical protein
MAPVVTFAVLGDVPYVEAQVPVLAAAIARFDDAGAAFAVHVGDVKSGSARCDDATLAARRDLLAASPVPLAYTPGDNEWTDCGRPEAGGFVPKERLARLRSLFFAAPLGAGALGAEAQEGWPENQRWRAGGVVFATFHVVGSRDDRVHPADAAARRTADLAWLEATFSAAADAPAVVLFQQADPQLSPRDFRSWTDAIAAAARAAGRPVLLVHGDSHLERGPNDGWLGVDGLWRYVVPGEIVAPRLVTVDPAAEVPFAVRPLPAERDGG